MYKYISEVKEPMDISFISDPNIIIEKIILGIPENLITNIKLYKTYNDINYFTLDVNSVSHIFIKFGIETVYRIYVKNREDEERVKLNLSELAK